MREKRQEMMNERRFGVSSDKDVQEKLMKIFEEELNELATTDYEVLEGTADNIKKLISSENPAEPVTEEGNWINLSCFFFNCFNGLFIVLP